MRRTYPWLRQLTAFLCSYEAIAVWINHERLPTFSRLTQQHRWIGAALVLALIAHLAVIPKMISGEQRKQPGKETVTNGTNHRGNASNDHNGTDGDGPEPYVST